MHVSIRFLDPSFVADIAEKYQLADAEVTTDQRDLTDGAVPIINSAGDVLAKFTWEPYRPGLSMIERMAPTIAITAIPIAALLVWLTRHLWRSTQELHFMAYHDAMTGLPNRLLFNIRLRDALEKARRSGGAVAVMMIDLDRFKHVNDSLGHPAGDELICQVSERLKSCVGSSATFARLGGDEFAAVVSSVADASDIENLAEHLLSEMERPFVIGGEQVVTSVSIGVALATGERISHSDLLRRADIALYEAKSKGRKRYQVFFDEMSDIVLRRRAIEQDLRVALETGTIVAAYQPVFDGRGEKMVGAEALVRWHHPVHGALSPDVFISIAEERGLIEALGDRVILVACQLLQETSIPWISINLSAYQLRNEGFATHLKSALAEKEIEAYRLQVEIRESVLMANDPTTRANLNHLQAAGIKITLDDFGTGYSSLNDLREYPVDKVKIDRSLVGQLASSQECEAIARAFVSLAKSLGKTVAVEGVETANDRIHALSLMCDEMQGYAISRPLSPLQLRSQFAEIWESNPGRRSIAV